MKSRLRNTPKKTSTQTQEYFRQTPFIVKAELICSARCPNLFQIRVVKSVGGFSKTCTLHKFNKRGNLEVIGAHFIDVGSRSRQWFVPETELQEELISS